VRVRAGVKSNEALPEAARTRVLQWAVRRHEAASLTFRRDEAWVVARSNFLWFDEAEGTLAVLYPVAVPPGAAIEVTRGEPVGVSFRRGHKKCVFSTTVLARQCDAAADVLLLARPDRLQELQRRAYQRAVVPGGQVVPVKVYGRGNAGGDAPLAEGQLRDISAAGAGVQVPTPYDPRIRIGGDVRVSIAGDAPGSSISLDGVVRHLTAQPGGIALGIQFRGLETSRHGQTMLSALASIARELRRPQRPNPERPGLP
jgi:c-di-GMP-binding flagellar brake protein YcgR